MKLGDVELDAIFGASSQGGTHAERANTSDRMFVRSQMQLAPATARATGRVLNAKEVLESFGISALIDVAIDGRSVIARDPDEPARTIGARRAELGFSPETVAARASVSRADVVKAEKVGEISSIHVLQRIAEALSLDDQKLGAEAGAGGDPKLGRRFRDMGQDTRYEEGNAATLSEAAWVIWRQCKLQRSLNDGSAVDLLAKFAGRSHDYSFRVADRGYMLAARTRRLLQLDDEQPISSVRSLAEDVLGLPVVQARLGGRVVGATISNHDCRGIVLSDRLDTEKLVLFRRMTIAHELGHLLWDPDGRLLPVQVDGSDEIDSVLGEKVEEMRANAFAVALLAPTIAVQRMNSSARSPSVALLEVVKRYGISAPAARFHLSNVCRIPLDAIALPKTSGAAQVRWHAMEGGRSATRLGPVQLPVMRSGRFAELVLRAVEARLVSEDTGASWLRCDRNVLRAATSSRPAGEADAP